MVLGALLAPILLAEPQGAVVWHTKPPKKVVEVVFFLFRESGPQNAQKNLQVWGNYHNLPRDTPGSSRYVEFLPFGMFFG